MKLPQASARAVAGGGIFLLTLIVLGMIWARPELADTDLFKMLAQAIVIQGLVGLAMAHYFTASSRPNEAQDVNVVNPKDDPVPTSNQAEGES